MSRLPGLWRWRGLLLVAVLSLACRDEPAPTAPPDQPAVRAAGPSADIVAAADAPPEVLIGAGDIASCSNNNDEATAKLLDANAGTVFTAGDNAYSTGAASDYSDCYQSTWGRHKARTKPAPGDRDYKTKNATGYFGYFGAAAGDPTKGYYSYDLGDWHVVVLNTKLSLTATSAQLTWLKNDLAASAKVCQAAVWHQPYYSSVSGLRTTLKPLWEVLYQQGVELVVSADDRVYERFAPQDANSQPSADYGVRQFIAGTGGAGKSTFGTILPNSEARSTGVYGVLKLTLSSGGYAWQFLPIPGKVTYTDAGSGACHGSPPSTEEPPVARPGGPYTGDDSVGFNGSTSSDPQGDTPLTYDWDFGDNTAHGTGATPSHTYAAEGTYTATLIVNDTKGNASAPATTTVTVANVAPTVSAQSLGTVTLGAASTVRVTFGDPGTADAPWSWSIDWGDGTAATTGTASTRGSFDVSHTYGTAGTFTVAAIVTDKDGGAGSAGTSVSVTLPNTNQILVGAGDIAECGTNYWNQYDEATANLINNSFPTATVFTAGDNAYPNGRAQDYANCYEPSWGQLKSRTFAALGNHEYDTGTATASFDYFGDRAGPRDKGYYSYDLGDWHIVVLNDNTSFVPSAAGSAQDAWLQADLAANTRQCTLAIWHQPMTWSQDLADAGYRSSRKIFWDRLYAAGAEIVVHGHQHFYERFAPMNPNRVRDDANGIRQFIVGTGGSSVDAPSTQNAPNSQVLGPDGGFGVIKFTLRSGGYDWEFVSIPNSPAGQFTDSGSGTCH